MSMNEEINRILKETLEQKIKKDMKFIEKSKIDFDFDCEFTKVKEIKNGEETKLISKMKLIPKNEM